MPPIAQNTAQLERWLTAYYEALVPEKASNTPRIAELFVNKQDELDKKLKEKHGKGLRYAAALAGEVQASKSGEKRKAVPSTADNTTQRPMKKVGAKLNV